MYLPKLDDYEFVFYIRIDLVLKPFFFESFRTTDNKVLWPFVCWRQDYKTGLGFPRVCDLMVFVPRARYHLLKCAAIILAHESYEYLVCNRLLSEHDIGYIVNTYHDSDSQKDWNPLYWTANRPSTDVWHSPGFMHNGHYDTLIVPCPPPPFQLPSI
jgi:hypothetical protein